MTNTANHLQPRPLPKTRNPIKMPAMTGRIVLVVVACWMVIGLLYLSSVILNAQKFDQPFVLSARVVFGNQTIFLCWALFNIVMISMVRHLSGRHTGWQYLALIGLAGLIWIPPNLWLDATFADWTFQRPTRSAIQIFSQTNFFSVFFVMMLYLTVFLSSLGWTFIERWQATREEALRLEQQMIAGQLEMADLRMQILKSQLSPHFLFNALGSISGLIRSAPPAKANTAIQTLGDMLRYTLSTDEQPLIHFAAEREFTDNYLALQQLRFGDRFCCTIASETIASNTTCPPFVLQTLIENAFVHGVERRDQPTAIDAKVWVRENRLNLSVSNPLPDNSKDANGLGMALQNLNKRLQLMFDGQASVTSKVVNDAYVARVSLPLVNALP